ncbi:hypothetical protein PPL_02190 [Heterostelium album PN500]|uniref:EGF-like domain-containing protein n=1 Tax=Heterostelium pallidum (strain ATCC 26659 / Pp 5 / PN500) TaxID=670386 RepID=D3B1L6_HETP5|nr:hypothetical protein PPL_02190 [Heterostelium album PN500]EFA85190.1 hypothetical protein PPL_02190 [Heterostelium album PN500]|eukprot:XP_020437299.1 hypothetical protein PPL_02190 [Heterostelium album PN500]
MYNVTTQPPSLTTNGVCNMRFSAVFTASFFMQVSNFQLGSNALNLANLDARSIRQDNLSKQFFDFYVDVTYSPTMKKTQLHLEFKNDTQGNFFINVGELECVGYTSDNFTIIEMSKPLNSEGWYMESLVKLNLYTEHRFQYDSSCTAPSIYSCYFVSMLNGGYFSLRVEMKARYSSLNSIIPITLNLNPFSLNITIDSSFPYNGDYGGSDYFNGYYPVRIENGTTTLINPASRGLYSYINDKNSDEISYNTMMVNYFNWNMGSFVTHSEVDTKMNGTIVRTFFSAYEQIPYTLSQSTDSGNDYRFTTGYPNSGTNLRNFGFTTEFPFLGEFEGSVYLSFGVMSQNVGLQSNYTEQPYINVQKVEYIKLSSYTFLFRIKVESNYDFLSASVRGSILYSSHLVDGTLQSGTFEKVITSRIESISNFNIVNVRGFSQMVAMYTPYNDNYEFIPSTVPFTRTDLNYQNITYFEIEKREIDLSNGPVSNTIRFNMSSILTDLIPSVACGTEYNGSFDPTVNQYVIHFVIEPIYLEGPLILAVYDGVTKESILIDTNLLIINITKSTNDLLQPRLDSVRAQPSTSLNASEDGQNYYGWEFVITDKPNGFYKATFDIVSDLDVLPRNVVMNATHFISGSPNDATYRIMFPVELPCRSQTFALTNINLFDSNYTTIAYSAINTIVNTPQEPQLKIYLNCSEIIDTSSINREFEASLSVTDGDGSGISKRHLPIIRLISENTNELYLETTLDTYNTSHATYHVKKQLPFGFGMRNILVSVTGLVDKQLNYNSYVSTDLRDAGFPYLIKKQFSTNIPILETASLFTSNGGSLTLTGQLFGVVQSKLKAYIDFNDGNDYQLVTTSFFSGLVLQLSNIKSINSTTIKVKVVKNDIYASNVLLVNVIRVNTPKPSLSPKPTSPPDASLCPGTPPCNNRGECTIGGCQCQSPWTGPTCSSQTIIIPPPTPQPDPSTGTNIPVNNNNVTSMINVVEVREIDDLDQIVQIFKISQWNFTDQSKSMNNPSYLYSSQLERTTTNINVTITYYQNQTNITFGESTLNIQASSIKYSIELSKFNFTKSTNLLQVVLEATIKSNNKDSCSSTQVGGKDGSKDDVKWIKMNIDKLSLYGRFIDFGIIDDKPTKITNRIIDDEDENTPQFRSIKVGITLPAYDNIALLDPDFSNLIDVETDSSISYLCKSKGGLSNGAIAGIVVGGVVFVSIAVGTTIFVMKKKKMKRENKKMTQRLKTIQK